METWTKGANEYAHHNGTARQTERDGKLYAGHKHWDAAQQQTQHNAYEYGHHVRLVKAFHHIAQFGSHALYALSLAHHRHTVAHAQCQVRGGHELYARALHTAHIHAVAVAQLQVAQVSSVNAGLRNEYALRYKF